MTIPDPVRREVEKRVAAFCDRRVPPATREQVQLEHSVRGDAVTIFECRPPWSPDFGLEWSESKVAQLRFDPRTATWTLWWPDRNGRWHRHEGVDAARDVEKLLHTVDEDPTGIFWG